MKDKLVKRRKHIDWNYVRITLEDQKINELYCLKKSETPWISDNRLSYWALQRVYSKAALDYFRITNDFRIFAIAYPHPHNLSVLFQKGLI